jgi:hypothetical protein
MAALDSSVPDSSEGKIPAKSLSLLSVFDVVGSDPDVAGGGA